MKEFVILLLGFALVTLIACPVQFVAADHLKPGIGIYKDETNVNIIPIRDSKYQIYLQVEVRNAQGQLVGIFEGTHGNIIAHKITDLTFDEKLGKKEIVTIDNIKYEKVQNVDVNPSKKEDALDYTAIWKKSLCGEIVGHEPSCLPVFRASTTVGLVSQTDVVINNWTILRVMN